MHNKIYNAQSIKVLKGLEAVKKRPGMYIGDTDDGSGLHHMIYEVVDNAIDEAVAGYCDRISIIINNDGSVTVTDNGRGIPVGLHEEGISAAELIMTQLHSGGKFDNESYKVSGGLHGVGVSVVNALSEWLILTIWNGNRKYTMKFKNGVKDHDLTSENNKDSLNTGTMIQFLPSNKIFSHIRFSFNILENRLRELAFLNSNIRINLKDSRHSPERFANFYCDAGIISFVKYLDRTRDVINKTVHIIGKHNLISLDAAFQWNNSYQENILVFTNNIKQKDGGTHLTGFRSGLTRSVNLYIEINKLYKKQRIKVSSEDVREGMTAVVSIHLVDPKFSSQTKDKLISIEAKSAVESLIFVNLNRWFEMNPKEARLLVRKVIQSFLAREAARKVKDLTRQQNANIIATLPGKLASCQEKNPVKSELFLVEGDSAGGSAKQARDRKTQAILSLKGKILNVERSGFDKMLTSSEIGNLITALKVIVEDKKFNIDNLRYHKIIIMTDADVDGAHIRTLLLTFFFRYMPSLVNKGYLYIASPPLYKVKRGNNTCYIKDDTSLQDYIYSVLRKNVKIKINRDVHEYSSMILTNLIEFYSIIKNYGANIPLYIFEFFVFNNFFGSSVDKSQLSMLLKKKFSVVNIIWKTESDNVSLSFSMVYQGVTKLFSIRTNIFTSKLKAQLSSIISILSSINDCIFFYKDIKITYHSFVDLLEKLVFHTKSSLYIQRFKGLGEMNPDQLWETTLDPTKRVLSQVSIEDFKKADLVFSTLMGDAVPPRRDFINHNSLIVENIDY